MTGLAFFHPLLLWALPLCAVPVLIHLLNRRRYHSRRWAAMEFLLLAMKRNRKRLRMEQWLVLLLRVLAVALLVLLVARPQLDGSILTGASRHHLLLLDDSASMAHRGGADSSFDQARTAIARLGDDLIATRPGDRLTLLRAGDPSLPLIDAVSIGPELKPRLSATLAELRIGDGELNALGMLDQAARRAEATGQPGEAEFYLVTDLRRRDWLDQDGRARPALVEWLEALDPDGRQLRVIAVGQADPANLAVRALRCADRRAVAGVPIRFEVEVVNRGDRISEPSELTIEVDAQSRVMRPVPPLEPGATTSIGIAQVFHRIGPHGLRASLGADRYTADDSRSLAIEVRPASRVLLIDGDPARRAEESETFFVAAALDPGGDAQGGIDLRSISEQDLAALPDEDLAATDQIWLCNVSRLTTPQVARLESFVAAGGGLVITLGDHCDLANYDQRLWKDGAGLLPARLTEFDGDLDAPRHLHLADAEHPAFARHVEEMRFMLAELVLCGRWVEQQVEADGRVLLTVGDAEGPALLSERRFGANSGRVFLLGTSIDTAWTDAPRWPLFPLLCHELVASGARAQDSGRLTLEPDQDFVLELDPGLHRPDVEIRQLGGELLRTVAAPPDGGERVELPMAEIPAYGLFELRRRRHAGGDDPLIVARNPLLAEGRLQPLGSAGFRSAYPPELSDRVTLFEGGALPTSGGVSGNGGLWRYLGLLMLVGLLGETLLAWRFGRR